MLSHLSQAVATSLLLLTSLLWIVLLVTLYSGVTSQVAGDLTCGTGTTFQLGSSSSAKLGVGREPLVYNLEVEGSIYSTGSTIIAGNGSAGKFILQKGAAAISLNFTNNSGTDEAVIDASGQFGLGKSPSTKFDVSGNANIDGDIVVTTTNPSNNTGGKISARELVLTDPSTGATTTLNAISGGGGLSRGKVYFLATINQSWRSNRMES